MPFIWLLWELTLNFPFSFTSLDSFIKLQLKLWRAVDPNSVDSLHPGKVTAVNLREKLAKQLKIDLEEDEAIHIVRLESSDTTTVAPVIFAEMSEAKVQSTVDEYQTGESQCSVEIKRLGEYLAKISLKGGYSVPLRFSVLQR